MRLPGLRSALQFRERCVPLRRRLSSPHRAQHLGEQDGSPPAPGTTGLYHFAINYPTRKDLAVALKRLLDHGWSIDGASDHGPHEAIYLHDPDFNGIELAWERPSQWPRRDGMVTFSRQPVHFASLLAELGEPDEKGYLTVLSACASHGYPHRIQSYHLTTSCR